MTTPATSGDETTPDDSLGLALTDLERNFFANHWHETMALTRGPAITWLVEHGIREREIYLFTTLHQREYHLAYGPPKPENCEIPWFSVEEFRARSLELRPLMDERQRKETFPL